MLAILTIERDPLQWADLPIYIRDWVQSAGGYAMVGIILWLIFGLGFMRKSVRERIPVWQSTIFTFLTVVALAAYLVLLVLRLPDIKSSLTPPPPQTSGQPAPPVVALSPREQVLLTAGGGCALLAVAIVLLPGIFALRWRRIFAISKLSFKEAIRRRALYAFSALLLVFLFASWFIPYKPEDQVRTYVQVVYWPMTFLLLVVAAFLAGFSIPTDIRQLTIQTVVTKPVEKFEIVLGRFIGFMALLTLVLLVMETLSLLYVIRGVGKDAAEESLKAREVQYGQLYFENTPSAARGDSVGREWEYRSYIAAPMPGQDPQTAIWGFPAFDAKPTSQNKVRCEFDFDIYRTTKGEENRGISCFFTFHGGPYDRARENQYRDRRERARNQGGASDAEIDEQLAKEFGFFEVPSKPIVDFHTLYIDVPAGLLAYAREHAQKNPTGLIDPNDPRTFARLPLQLRVRCISRTQYVGMARPDLYFRTDNADSGADRARFALNFYKGALGLWLLLCLITGVAVSVSTYLTGVISMLLALLLYLAGLAREFIQTVATGTNVGGGPVESMIRLVGREHITAPRDVTTSQKVAEFSDVGFRFMIRRVVDIIPDVDRYDLTQYVSEGFNISGAQLGLDVLLMVGYLLPWMVLGYFVMKWREIATW